MALPGQPRLQAARTHELGVLPAAAAGDDPNYWVKLTQQADADYVTRKVRKMLADINQPGSKQVGTGHMQRGAIAAGRKAGLTTSCVQAAMALSSRGITSTRLQLGENLMPPLRLFVSLPQPSGGGGGGEHPPEPELCISPQTERASTMTGKHGWFGNVQDQLSRLAQRMSRTNLFSRSSDSYRPYMADMSPHHSPVAGSQDGSELQHQPRSGSTTWMTAASQRTVAAGMLASAAGSDGVDGSLRNSKDSSEGPGSGPATAAGSKSGGSNAGGVLSSGGKRWSSGSSSGAGAAAVGSSEGGSAATGSSRGGADNSSGSESSGGGAVDGISRKLRLSGSRNKGAARSGVQQAAGAAAAGNQGAGTPPTYQTISELHSMTAAQVSCGCGWFCALHALSLALMLLA